MVRGVSVWLEAGLEGGPGEGRKDGVTGSRETGRLKGGEETLLASPSLTLSLFISFLPPTYTHTHTHTSSEADTKTPSHSDNRQRKSLYVYTLCHRGRMG